MNSRISPVKVSRRRFINTGIASGGTLCLSSLGARGASDLDVLYSEAKREGRLNYYGGGPTKTHQRAIDEFSKSFPGIEFNLVAGFSNQLTSRIDEQIARNKIETDVAVLQTIQDFERWKRVGVLSADRGPNFDQVLEKFKDPDGYSVGVRVYALTYAYNPVQVAAGDVPRSASDFLRPEFSGKIVSTYPHDDDITLYLYHTIVQKYGWDYMKRFMENKPRFIRGHLGVTQEIVSGRAALSFDVSASSIPQGSDELSRIRVAFPSEDPIPIFETRFGIFNGAPHPNAARLFRAWLLSRDYQLRQGVWSVRGDVVPTGGLKPIAEYNTANQFRDFIITESLVSDLRKRFESYIGPVSGDPVLGQGGSSQKVSTSDRPVP
jgi:ABC-type Fe3+ transport system substrate-binding protein